MHDEGGATFLEETQFELAANECLSGELLETIASIDHG
jgi:hypothetical protein